MNFYATFRPIVGGKSVSLPLPEGSTIAQVIENVIEQYPALRAQLFNERGELFPHVHVFVNGRDVPYLPNTFQTILTEKDTVDIFPPVGGG